MKKLADVLARGLLGVSACIHLYFGIAFVIDPEPWMRNLSIGAISAAGLVEMTAFYGGLLSSLGLLFLVASIAQSFRTAGVILMTVTYSGAASSRALAMLRYGAEDPILLGLLAIETGGAALGLLALALRSHRPRPAPPSSTDGE